MLRKFAWMAALVALIPMAVHAHGPTRQKVVSKIEINAPVDKVWAVVGNWQDMSWHPAFSKTEGEGGNAAGAKRTLTVAEGGGKIFEKLSKYDPELRALAYEITEVDVKVVPVTNYSAQMTVTGTAEKSIVEWRSAFYRGYINNDPPPELSDEAAVKAITGVFESGLAALKKKMEGG
ncbi:MAG: SRPBCC family protein [Hyphomicrobium sp.]|nr:SRPBCC family protein [Hyphomicrobium sp.]